jgi:hypothetical protein
MQSTKPPAAIRLQRTAFLILRNVRQARLFYTVKNITLTIDYYYFVYKRHRMSIRSEAFAHKTSCTATLAARPHLFMYPKKGIAIERFITFICASK